jgi:hypothetical protein
MRIKRIKAGLIVMGMIIAAAGVAHAVTVQKSTFKNTQATFFAFLETDVECSDGTPSTATTQVFLNGGSFVNPFGSGTGTSIDIFGFSSGCGEFFDEADGFIQGGVTGPNPPLTSARLTGTGDIPIDFGPGGTATVTLDLTFTGDGQLSASRGVTQTKTATTPAGPFTITVERGAFRNRTSDATGTITIQGVVFPVDLPMGAIMLDNNSTTITVSKP